MNRQNFNITDGFPYETENLNDMQTAFSLFNYLGNIAGNFAIISGCEEGANGTIGNGVVQINDETLEFRSGIISDNVIIVEEIFQKEFEDGSNKDVLFVRYATFGVASVTYPWANFKRPKTTIQLTEDVKQIQIDLQSKADTSVIQGLINRIIALEARPAFVDPVKNKGYFTLGDIYPANGVAGTQFPAFGDCLTAVLLPDIDGGNTYIEVTLKNAMASPNYKVDFQIESLGSISADDDAMNPVFKIVSETKFKVGIVELSPSLQSVRIHFETREL